MSQSMQGAIEAALGDQLPPAIPQDAVAGSVPAIPDAKTEAGALTLERNLPDGVVLANRMRRRWYIAREDRLNGRLGHPPAGVTTLLYDAGCGLCDGKGMVADRSQPVHTTYTFCTCGAGAKRQAEQREAAKWSMLGALPHARFLRSENRREQEAAMEMALAFLQAVDAGAGPWLTLVGDTIGGKTHIAACIGNACLDAGRPVVMHKVPMLLDHLRAAFNPNVGGQYDALFEKVKTVEILVLDDLGAEKQTDWASDRLYQLLDERTTYHRPTVITVNDLLDNLPRRIMGRVALAPERGLCVVPTSRGKPDKGYYMVQHQPWICRECGCRPHLPECPQAGAQSAPAALAAGPGGGVTA